VLMRHDIAPIVPKVQPGDDVVILVHGIFASAGVFRPLKARLERDAGAKVASFSHAPGVGVRRIARQLAKLVQRIPFGARIHIVGHSLGGIVSRYFVQEMGGHARVTQTISLASPFGGTHIARGLPVLVGADLHSESSVLGSLRSRAPEIRVPHTSIVAGADWLVIGHARAVHPHGEVVLLPGRSHNTLLYDEDVAALVIERIRRHRI
jgi:triacylglycerol lipase